MTTLLIDNYDSFTYNIYQYLCQLGAKVEVYRNDKITLEECIKLNPRNVVISPGPGHPDNSSGISKDVIKHFEGKVPIFGVCLGEQCMYSLYGGTVTYTGEIVHGKTSPLTHDGKGVFSGIPQGIEVTRYHSLSGDPDTLPECLEITSWTDSRKVMGIRHKKYVIEGVQFHPESIASEYGKTLLANFLKWEGGTWDTLKIREDLINPINEHIPRSLRSNISGGGQNYQITLPSTSSKPTEVKQQSILERIAEQRRIDVANAKAIPGRSSYHLEKCIALGLAPPTINFAERLKRGTHPNDDVALMAEVKRASPSKGNIDITAHSAAQALVYAKGGASAISVLTEPTWFKGNLNDLRDVRQVLDQLPDRPAILRKDFIVDKYQILEARLCGADTVLLIVAILTDEQLKEFMAFARTLSMEPLVEVNKASEMERAIKLGAKVIGVNNRNLHTFNVDPKTTTNLANMVSGDIILAALSGINSRDDVDNYVNAGARAILVGEALMRADNTDHFIKELLGRVPPTKVKKTVDEIIEETSGVPRPLKDNHTLVKICGISNVEDAIATAKAGADFIGLVFFKKSPRYVTPEKAKEIVIALNHYREEKYGASSLTVECQMPYPGDASLSSWFNTTSKIIGLTLEKRKPLVVGLFVNETYEYINSIVRDVGLDIVQLHGQEPLELARMIPVPVLKALSIGPTDTEKEVIENIRKGNGLNSMFLLDTKVVRSDLPGGNGVTFNWELVREVSKTIPFMVAGGLDSNNVKEAIEMMHPWAVDVSSGVEKAKGVKDLEKIKQFINDAKSV
ncbi:IGPS-domain-containing protein [Anaeromyces robustus]|jgi:anthranilate synthase/indole-3-glycerol phosphate synthase/phosphoribosylanthranilate isomerase|uniref:Multifunctional tryptophan biosynthesis protein n=1 Tax=Anaeromyces robustus TaxID=1754192 RepID=A0A1Y1XLN1_9FUNG|nr:IGPS-domain-containing protein [Anaeromyces robustus]|eukprot:ORX86658.1 IGPS-domain-containing protein [Anaeromyces robustus]